MLTVGWLVRPHTPNPEKLATYECGELPVQAAWFNFNPRFYIVALVFLVFDVEVAFTYPVAVVFRRWVARGAGGVAFVELARVRRDPAPRARVRVAARRSRLDPR